MTEAPGRRMVKEGIPTSMTSFFRSLRDLIYGLVICLTYLPRAPQIVCEFERKLETGTIVSQPLCDTKMPHV